MIILKTTSRDQVLKKRSHRQLAIKPREESFCALQWSAVVILHVATILSLFKTQINKAYII